MDAEKIEKALKIDPDKEKQSMASDNKRLEREKANTEAMSDVMAKNSPAESKNYDQKAKGIGHELDSRKP